ASCAFSKLAMSSMLPTKLAREGPALPPIVLPNRALPKSTPAALQALIVTSNTSANSKLHVARLQFSKLAPLRSAREKLQPARLSLSKNEQRTKTASVKLVPAKRQREKVQSSNRAPASSASPS